VTSLAPASARCWRCDGAVDAVDRYCRWCGYGQGAFVAWYYRPVWIVVLSLTVLGPFALPLIWRTPLLGRGTKWILSLALIAICAWVGWGFVVEVHRFLDQYQGADELLSL
jgi:hypothetical protein